MSNKPIYNEKIHYGYIYITTNLVNNKKYIGQHKGEYDPKYFGSGTIIKKAIKKYGVENFVNEVLFYCSSKEELDEKETDVIREHQATLLEIYYNIAPGGMGGCSHGESNGCYNKVICVDESGNTYLVTREEYETGNHVCVSSGENNKMFGNVLCVDESGNTYLVTREEYETGNHLSFQHINAKRGESHHFYKKKRSQEDRNKISQNTKQAMSRPDVKQRVKEGLIKYNEMLNENTDLKQEIQDKRTASLNEFWKSDEGLKIRKEKSENISGENNSFYGKTHKLVTCPHCGKTGAEGPMKKQWHFDYCKKNPDRKLNQNERKA